MKGIVTLGHPIRIPNHHNPNHRAWPLAEKLLAEKKTCGPRLSQIYLRSFRFFNDFAHIPWEDT